MDDTASFTRWLLNVLPLELTLPRSPSMSVRQDMVANAVSFLRDPSLANSPLGKRIAFLEAKGLTPSEVELAMRQSQNAGPPAVYGGSYGNAAYSQRPGMDRDWRDWFIMAVVGSGVGYLCAALARKYVVPALQPPTETELVAAREALEARYDEAAKVLESLRDETGQIQERLDRQADEVAKGVDEVREAVREVRERDQKRDEDVKACRDEVETIREMLPRVRLKFQRRSLNCQMMDKSKDAQTNALNDLQQELKSLKSLLNARRPGAAPAPDSPSSSSSIPTSRFGTSSGLGSRPPGIPAWQLAQSGSSAASTPAAESSTADAPVPAVAPAAASPAATEAS